MIRILNIKNEYDCINNIRKNAIMYSDFKKLYNSNEISEFSNIDLFLSETSKTFTYILDNKIVGFISFNNKSINMLYVEPQYSGLNIGIELLKHAELLIFKNFNYIILGSTLNAIEFYKKNGYKEISKESLLINNIAIPYIKMKKFK